MFDISASSLPTGLQPAPAMQAVMPEITADLADPVAPPTPTPDFGAMLALQSTVPAPAIALPESGKTLPDPATTAVRPLAAVEIKGAQVLGEDEAETELPAEAPQPEMLLPDMAFLSAIFAAPDRLPPANATAQDRPATAAPTQRDQEPVTPANTMPASVQQATIALAKQAQIELAQPVDATEPSTKTGSVDQIDDLTAEDSPSPEAPRRTSMPHKRTAPEIAAPATVATLAVRTRQAEPARLSERLTTETTEPQVTGLLTPDQPTPTEPQAASSPRTQPAPEKVDFATLVDTLARAREEASPRAIHASVTHAEFGRVSLRFDRDEDNALSVAMSSADPGFARAVGAAAEASPASNETAGQAPRQQTSADARTSQGEGQRHQPQDEQARQRPATNAAPRHASAEQASTGRDTRDIYA